MTITALATASTQAAINIIRLSGVDSLKIAAQLLRPKDAAKLASKVRYAHYFDLFYEGELLDSAIVLYFKAPFSFTGEDCVELQIHGGYSIAQHILSILHSLGARYARAGEFSKRACINGKMSLEQALLINELINAKSQNARKIISKNLNHGFEQLIKDTQDELIKTLAFIETAIDYADDDLPDDILELAKEKLSRNAQALEQIANRSEKKRGLIEGYKLAIIGEPNVGKSSLLNALLNYERAIVSNIAGTTRDSVEELMNFNGHLIKLVDTAGIRHSDDAIEELGVKRSYESMQMADIVLFVLDASKKLSQKERELLEMIKESKKPHFILLNKSDLAKNCELDGIKISAINSDIKDFENALKDYLDAQMDDELVLTNTMLIDTFYKASKSICDALDNFNELEICAYYLNESLKLLAIFGKKTGNDELFDAMFSTFCLGK